MKNNCTQVDADEFGLIKKEDLDEYKFLLRKTYECKIIILYHFIMISKLLQETLK